MIKKRRIGLGLAAGLTAELANKAFPILTLRLAQEKLGLERFGYAQFSLWIVDICSLAVILGYPTLAAIEIGAARSDDDIRRVITDTTILKLIHALVAFVATGLVLANVPSYGHYAPAFFVLGFVPLSSALEMTYVNIGTQRMPALSGLALVAKTASLIAVYALVRGADDALLYAVLTAGANAAIALGSMVMALKRYPFVKPRWSRLRQHFIKVLPFALAFAASVTIERFDMLLVETHLGTAATGLYAGPLKLAQGLAPLAAIVTTVFFAEMVALSEEREAMSQHTDASFMAVVMILFPTAVGTYFVAGPALALLIGPAFDSAAPVLVILVAGLVFQAIFGVFGLQVLMTMKRMRTLNTIMIVAASVGVLVALVAIPRFALVGVAGGVLAARATAAGAAVVAARQFLNGLPWGHLARVGAASLAMGAALSALNTPSFIANVGVGAAVYLLGIAILYRPLTQSIAARLRK